MHGFSVDCHWETLLTTRGHCLCGQTRWSFDGAISWACYCHFDDCRRNCSALVVAWIGVPLKNFQWRGQSPKSIESSAGVQRHFCASCGSPMGFEAEHYAGGMQLYAASLEDPAAFKPEFHVNYQSRLPWLHMNDDLPKYDGTLLNTPDNPSY